MNNDEVIIDSLNNPDFKTLISCNALKNVNKLFLKDKHCDCDWKEYKCFASFYPWYVC